MTNKHKTIKRTAFITIFGLSLFALLWYFTSNKYQQPQLEQVTELQVATVIDPARSIAPFRVSDDTGGDFTEASLRNHWTLLFFGYPKCPDICPRTLGTVRDAWNTYKPHTDVRFVFASITPEPVENGNLKAFVQNFHPQFIGISGTPSAMQQLSDQLGVFSKNKDGKIDHTASLMLIDPQGKLTAVFTPPFSAEQIAADLEVLTQT